MYAALIPVATRVGPYLGRLAKTSPTLIETLGSTLRAGGAKVASSVGSIAKWMGANKSNAALGIFTLASLGVSVADLIDDSASDADELKTQIDRVIAQSQLSQKEIGKARDKILGAGLHDESLQLAIAENKVNRAAAIAVLGWALSFYGSNLAAIRAHKMHQAFFEMPLADVTSGMADLDLSPSKVAAAIQAMEMA